MYTPSKSKVTEHALHIAEAFNHFVDNHTTNLPVVPEDSLIGKDWVVDGYILANTGVAGAVAFGQDVPFGYVVHSKSNPSEYKAIIRGTGTTLEWLDNMKTLMIDHPSGCGKVEDGFFDIYNTMSFIKDRNDTSKRVPLSEGISTLITENKGNVTVVGHSLGATLSTYLTYDLVNKHDMGEHASMCCFASPKPGNRDFVQSFDATVKNYVVYNYEKDMVPDVPLGLMGYQSLPHIVEITPSTSEAVINNGIMSNHHVVCYAAMLNYQYTNDWRSLLIANHDEPYCIIGENRPLITKSLNSIGLGLNWPRNTSQNRWGIQGFTSESMYAALTGVAALGALNGLTHFHGVAAAATVSGLAYALRDGGTEVTSVVKAKIKSIGQWAFQFKLNREMNTLFKDNQSLDELAATRTRLRGYQQQCDAMYVTLQPEIAYLGHAFTEKFEQSHKEASFSIDLLNITVNTQEMVLDLQHIQQNDTFTPDELSRVVQYTAMLDDKRPSNVHDIKTYSVLIKNVALQAQKKLELDTQLVIAGLSDTMPDQSRIAFKDALAQYNSQHKQEPASLSVGEAGLREILPSMTLSMA